MSDKAEVPEKVPDADDEKSIVQMMEEGRRKRFAEKMRALQGKLNLNIDIDELRGRNRN